MRIPDLDLDLLRAFVTVAERGGFTAAGLVLGLTQSAISRQIKALEEQLPLHTNVVRFIVSQCEDVQVPNLRRKTRMECDSLLEQHGYQTIKGSYDYIMRLPVSSFTKEVSDKHVAEMETIRTEIARLQSTNAEKLWLADLESV